MRKTLRRILASLLTAVMLLTAAPLSGFVGLDIDFGWLDFSTKASALSSSGSCGTNVTYTFDSDTGLLTIGGTGDMQNYRENSPFNNNSSIKRVVINSGVTSIGSSAFNGCTGLTSITIPDSVTNIGGDAFEYCTGLTSVTIGNSVTSIGWSAFCGCTNLTSITIPDSVTNIGEDAFKWCTGLTSVKIGNGVTNIGYYSFLRCTGLTSITVDSNNPVYDSRENCNAIIETKSNILIQGCKNTIIPNSVTSIGVLAFSGCTGLTSVTIPNSVTSIGRAAFDGCTGLTSINVDINNAVYDNRNNCNAIIETESNILVRGCKNTIIPNSVTSIGEYAFSGCTGLTNITIPNSVTSIGDCAFYDCTDLRSITIPDSVTSIYINVFMGCYNIYLLVYSDSFAEQYAVDNSLNYRIISKIPDDTDTVSGKVTNSFWWSVDKSTGTLTLDCKGEMVSFENDVAPWIQYEEYIKHIVISDGCTSIGKNAFMLCSKVESVSISDSVTIIDDSAFRCCTSLTNITIPNSVTSIGRDAFAGCTGLTSITIPNSVTSIGSSAFEYCIGLTNITIGNGVENIGYDAFRCCTGLTSITIPDSVTSIGSSAFEYCTGLTSVTIPDSVTSIGISAFDNTGYYNNTKNWEDNVLYIGNHLIKANDEISGSYTIKSGTRTIADYAFFCCTGVTDITIPDSVTSVGSYAFEYCTGLTNVIIGNSVKRIGDHAFEDCTGLTNVIIGNSVTSIGAWVFYDCTNLTSVTIPKSVMYIGSDAFGYEKVDSYNSKYNSQKVPNFKLYCYTGTAGERYAIGNEFDYELLEPSTVTDKNSGISLEFPAWAYNGDVTLKVKEVLSGSSFDIAEKISGKTHLKVFSIETYVYGESVQPNGEVTVKIPVPDGFNVEKCKLYYLNASSKNPEEIAITIKDGYIVFKTNHFSDWAIVQFADLGDVNEDSKINSSDALLVLRHSTGLITLSDSKKLNADVTRDGKINSTDALRILQYSTGLVTSF